MKLSTKGRYGVTAMYDLAMHMGKGPISLKSVAERQEISEHYLEQLMDYATTDEALVTLNKYDVLLKTLAQKIH